MAQGVYNQLLSQLDGLKEQVVAMEGEFEGKLSQLTERLHPAAIDKKPSSTEVPAPLSQEEDALSTGTSSEESAEYTPDAITQLQQLLESIEGGAYLEEQPSDTADQASKTEEEAPVSGDSQAPVTYEDKVALEFLPPANISQILEIEKYLDTLPEVESTEIIPITDRPVIMVFLHEPMQLVDVLSALPAVSHLTEDTNGSDQTEGKSRKIQITLSRETNPDKAES